MDEEQQRSRYRLLLILENVPYGSIGWTCQVKLDGGHSWELSADDPIVPLNSSPGVHTITVSVSRSVSRTANFRIMEDQYVTRVFIQSGANSIDFKVDAGSRSSRPAEDLPSAPARAQQPSARASRRNWILALIVVFLLGIVAALVWYNFILRPARAAAAEPSPSPAVTGTQPPDASAAPSDAGAYAVEIRGARRAVDDAGRSAVVVSYFWTNNSDATVSASELLHGDAFQRGIQLTATTVSDPGLYDPTSAMRQLRPNASLEIQAAFVLMDETSAVEFEVSPLPGVTGTTVLVEFDPAEMEMTELIE